MAYRTCSWRLLALPSLLLAGCSVNSTADDDPALEASSAQRESVSPNATPTELEATFRQAVVFATAAYSANLYGAPRQLSLQEFRDVAVGGILDSVSIDGPSLEEASLASPDALRARMNKLLDDRFGDAWPADFVNRYSLSDSVDVAGAPAGTGQPKPHDGWVELVKNISAFALNYKLKEVYEIVVQRQIRVTGISLGRDVSADLYLSTSQPRVQVLWRF